MRLIDQLLDHPLLEERPVKRILEPLGFHVHIETLDIPDQDEEPEDAERFGADPNAFMAAIAFEVPVGFTELDRFDNEDGEIVMLAVKPNSQMAASMMAPVAQEGA
ncbi:hypothetical protein QWY79_10400 [Halomonas sabkhae]|uniref:hypothetical protein n=1 Tax=Halomonas sabkhae TaxID=626223 RepID=UPI0025B4F734|nr:hypothetical protein [Halomonas sabkhae]MDN3525673.1 hypothetical protein [Halomonas sabkhae]